MVTKIEKTVNEANMFKAFINDSLFSFSFFLSRVENQIIFKILSGKQKV